MKILMAAAENDALPRGKVGGIGDVVRDIPLALADVGQEVDVVMPGYGHFSLLPEAEHVTSLQVMFGGQYQLVEVYKVNMTNSADKKEKNISQWVIEHPLFASGGKGVIYCDDPSHRPFASDASKFSLFSAAVAKAIISDVFGDIDIIHLHDWHTAMLAVLRAYDPEFQALQSIKTVYTIHNLALQGIRPIEGDESSLKAWFPKLAFDENKINDPRYNNCYNPMRAGINLSDNVHAVSPKYAKEILLASNAEHGYFGGEGLEGDLRIAAHSGRLHGILNGCEYPEEKGQPTKSVKATQINKGLALTHLLKMFEQQLMQWVKNKPLVETAHLIALTRIKQQLEHKYTTPPLILTSVGRITAQKVALFQQTLPNGENALSALLDLLGDKGVFVLLGSGDTHLENFLTEVAANKANFIFIKGYSEALPEAMYNSGDLFMMPSSFEPCGISQMLAMRAGQPCLVHSVGGLSDTIAHDENGFSFNGETPQAQAVNMLACFQTAMTLKHKKPKAWKNIANNALNSRFFWNDVAQEYIKSLYN